LNKEQSYRWLKFGDIKGETGSTIVAAKNQVLSTNCLRKKIVREEIESKCQLCEEYEETTGHRTSGGTFWQRMNTS
jgi:hypothetical protein